MNRFYRGVVRGVRTVAVLAAMTPVGLLVLGSHQTVRADSGIMLADYAPKEKYQERIPVPQEESRPQAEHRTEMNGEEMGCFHVRVSPGVTVWFFDEEDTEVGPAGYLDVFHDDVPLNFRVGVEGVHMPSSQPGSEAFAEWPGKEARLTYLRIPFALEYRTQVYDRTEFFIGGGPDIINTANDNSDTSVGGHLSARVGYNFTDTWGVAVEAGYMWGSVDSSGGDINLDGAFITPLLTATF